MVWLSRLSAGISLWKCRGPAACMHASNNSLPYSIDMDAFWSRDSIILAPMLTMQPGEGH